MGFSACHPAINLIYFVCVLAATLYVPHPIYLSVGALCAAIYCIKLNRLRGAVFSLILIPAVALFAAWYSGYTHFGVTALGYNFIGNPMTLESMVYGLILGGSVAVTCIWLACVHAIFTADKVVYLFGRVSPRLSLFLAIMLRMVPRTKAQAKKLNLARQGIGRGVNQGNLFRRFINAICIFSMLVTWFIEAMTTLSESMQNRGSTLRGRTAFSIYRFDNRDRAFVIWIFAAMTLLLMGLLLQQGYAVYDPILRLNPITPMSWVFYGEYAVLCLTPFGLDVFTEFHFRQARKEHFHEAA